MDRTTYGACERGPDGTIIYKVEKLKADAGVQTIISTIYKVQVSLDVTDVRYVAELPKDLRTFHVWHPGVRRYML